MKETMPSGIIRQRSTKCLQKQVSTSRVIPLSPSKSKAVKSELMAMPSSSNSTSSPQASGLTSFTQLYAFEDAESINGLEVQNETMPHSGIPASSNSEDQRKSAYVQLDEQTHANRLQRQEKMMSNKGTKTAYNQHIINYERFWVQYQSENPAFLGIPAQPVTAAKASLFLEHEVSREKRTARTGEIIHDSSIGSSHVSQVINALERHRKDHQHEPEYQACPDSLQPLRRDVRISTYEKGSKADEPKRIREAHTLKASGVSSDTFTDEELIRLSMRSIFSSIDSGATHATATQLYMGLRDRAMVLVSSSIAFRGDSLRSLLWSDLELRNVPMINIGLDAKVPALVFLANQGKTNSDGCIEEHAAFRHRIPELCSVGATGLLFFGYFHILKKPIPDFIPNFSVGEYGKREWYRFHVFNSGSQLEEMSYDNHRKRLKELYNKEGISITKVTHAGRKFAGTWSRYHGSSHEDTKALGNWTSKTDGSMPLYVDALPIPSMLSMSGWNGTKQESYALVREGLDAPTDLLTGIFPWVETEQSALESRQKQFGRKADDPRLRHFLNLLIFFRTVILQDAAVLYSRYPNCPLFDYYPFTTPLFHSFAVSAGPLLDAAEVEGRHRLNNLPEQFSASLRGIVTMFALENQKLSQALHEQTSMLKAMQQGHLGDATRSEPPRKRRKVVYTSDSLASSKSALDNVLSPSTPNAVPNLPSPAAFPIISASDIVPLSVPETTMSTSGELYSASVFQLSDIPQIRGLQLKGIDILEAEFGATRLRHHSFRWTMSDASDVPDEWRPSYEFYQPGANKQATLEDIWKEWSVGINGCISVERLGQYWDT